MSSCWKVLHMQCLLPPITSALCTICPASVWVAWAWKGRMPLAHGKIYGVSQVGLGLGFGLSFSWEVCIWVALHAEYTHIALNQVSSQFFIHLSIHPFIHSSNHPSPYWFIHSLFIRPFIHSFVRSFVRPFVPSFIHPVIQSSIHRFVHLSTHPFMRSSNHQLIMQTCIHLLNCSLI